MYAAVAEIRARKLPDPRVQGNVGSFFKNPVVSPEVAERLAAHHPELPRHALPDGRVKLAAGWMIERCGLNGVRVGGAAGTVLDSSISFLFRRSSTAPRSAACLGPSLIVVLRWRSASPSRLPA